MEENLKNLLQKTYFQKARCPEKSKQKNNNA